jgi:hypothetical protein
MEVLLTVLSTILEHLLNLKWTKRDSLADFCRSLIKLRESSVDFLSKLQTLHANLKVDVAPAIVFREDVDASYDTKSFSRMDTSLLKSHLPDSQSNRVEALAKHYNELNRIRDEILSLVAKELKTLKSAGIFMPALEESVLTVMVIDRPSLMSDLLQVCGFWGKRVKRVETKASNSGVGIIRVELEQPVKQSRDTYTSFHVPLMLAVSSKSRAKLDNYLKELEWSMEQMRNFKGILDDFIRSNCTLDKVI